MRRFGSAMLGKFVFVLQRAMLMEKSVICDDDNKVKTAFSSLLTYLNNVASNPDKEKFRKIRLSNAAFQNRVGKVEGGIQFLELCGFAKMEGDEFLFMTRDKFDMAVLVSAGTELDNAIKNPFFGVL
ncbi:hypothetical protein RJ639_026385 [Escallonia herrerae]|uniref:PUB domain-containing protein n=1 Tax=Escallonia herrerae TaxID=1293975 RepID=A0AA88SQP6_9ASTE|nr:hypothetical protein RJ639_026385 [Escallonia herrerae]